MTEIVLQSQLRNRGKFLEQSAQQYDPLFPGDSIGIQEAIASRRNMTDYTQRAVLGSSLLCELRELYYTSECYLLIEMAALTAGTYSDYLGISLIDRIVVRHGDVLQEFNYSQAIEHILTNWGSDSKRRQFLNSVGPSTGVANPGAFVVPLPVFWSKLIDPNNAPLPTHMLQSPVQIEIYFRTGANIASAAGVGMGFTSVKFMQEQIDTTAVVKSNHLSMIDSWNYKSLDFQTSRRYTLASGTPLDIDLSYLDGSFTGLLVISVPETDITTAKNYFYKDTIDSYELEIDGQLYGQTQNSVIMEYESLFLKGINATSTNLNLYHATWVPFSLTAEGAVRDFSGVLDMADVKHLILKLTSSTGVNQSVEVLGVRHVSYSIRNGFLSKFK